MRSTSFWPISIAATSVGSWVRARALHHLHVDEGLQSAAKLSGDRAQLATALRGINQLSVVRPPDIPVKGRSV